MDIEGQVVGKAPTGIDVAMARKLGNVDAGVSVERVTTLGRSPGMRELRGADAPDSNCQ